MAYSSVVHLDKHLDTELEGTLHRRERAVVQCEGAMTGAEGEDDRPRRMLFPAATVQRYVFAAVKPPRRIGEPDASREPVAPPSLELHKTR